MERALPRFHAVTDDAVLADPSFADRARAALESGGAALALHLRGPHTPGGPLHALAQALVPVAEDRGALLVVNDRVDVALVTGAHGVQLGARSLPVAPVRALLGRGRGVGVSTHGAAEARAAAEDGADWAFVGTIYATPSHPERPGAGPGALGSALEAGGGLPLVAIGGVTPERVGAVVRAGAWGVAAVRGVWGATDPAEAVERYVRALDEETR